MFKKMKSHPALSYFNGGDGGVGDEDVDEQTAAIQLRIERLKEKRIAKQRKKEMEAMQTYETLFKSLNKLEALNLDKKFGNDPRLKYQTESELDAIPETNPKSKPKPKSRSGNNSNDDIEDVLNVFRK